MVVRSLADVPKEGCRWVSWLLGEKMKNMMLNNQQKNLKNNAILNLGKSSILVSLTLVSFPLIFYMDQPNTHLETLGPGPSTEAEAEATEGEDEGILPVQDAAVPPGSSGGGAAAKMEGSEALPPAMPRKEAARNEMIRHTCF